MIFRDRVGGGGKAKASLIAVCVALEDRRRHLTTSFAGRVGEAWEVAGGGSSKDICNVEN